MYVYTPRGEIKHTTHHTPRAGKGIVSPTACPEGLTRESRIVDPPPPSHPKDVHPFERREATPLDGRPRTRARGSAPSPPTTDIMSFVSASARARLRRRQGDDGEEVLRHHRRRAQGEDRIRDRPRQASGARARRAGHRARPGRARRGG